jgi:hypothetical protein
MTIVVIGGSGLIGSKDRRHWRSRRCRPSPKSGVNSITAGGASSSPA